MPARRKPLPQPCPQCGAEHGTCRIIVFNPRWSYTPNSEPRVILGIGHYSPKSYMVPQGEIFYTYNHSVGPTSYRRGVKSGKIWHNFMLSLSGYKFKFRYTERSRTFPLSKRLFYRFEKEGYPIFIKGAHFLKKGGLMKCDSWYDCNNLVKASDVRKLRAYSLCDVCYIKATEGRLEP